MLFTGLGRSILGETALGLSTALGRYSRPRAQFFPAGE